MRRRRVKTTTVPSATEAKSGVSASAVPSATSSQWNDPEYLESLRSQAKQVTIKENEPAQLNVVVKAPGGGA